MLIRQPSRAAWGSLLATYVCECCSFEFWLENHPRMTLKWSWCKAGGIDEKFLSQVSLPFPDIQTPDIYYLPCYSASGLVLKLICAIALHAKSIKAAGKLLLLHHQPIWNVDQRADHMRYKVCTGPSGTISLPDFKYIPRNSGLNQEKVESCTLGSNMHVRNSSQTQNI